jgi:Zn-dependent protease with chaperone function
MLFLNKHQFITLLAFLLLACIVIGLTYLINKFGWLNTSIGFIALAAISLIIFSLQKNRYSRLYRKYNDEELVKKIMKRTLWQRQTAE